MLKRNVDADFFPHQNAFGFGMYLSVTTNLNVYIRNDISVTLLDFIIPTILAVDFGIAT
jgi:hypothetical protein